MKETLLGKTGLRVSRLCFGTMSFGDDADRATSAQLYRRCREVGINFFDCANVYSGGQSERILGKLVAKERDKVVLATKGGFPAPGREGPAARGLSRKALYQALNDSLERLGSDYVDLYFLHGFDPDTAIEETLEALTDLRREGKLRYVGVSNFAAWQVAKALGLAALRDWAGVSCIQPMYSLLKRQAEVELLPLAASEGLGAVCYSPLAAGILVGKHRGPGAQAAARSRLAGNETYQKRDGAAWMYEAADKFKRLAEERDLHPATLAVAWVARRPGVTAPIIGARNLEQLEPSLAAAKAAIDEETFREAEALFPAPPPATDRTESQA